MVIEGHRAEKAEERTPGDVVVKAEVVAPIVQAGGHDAASGARLDAGSETGARRLKHYNGAKSAVDGAAHPLC